MKDSESPDGNPALGGNVLPFLRDEDQLGKAMLAMEQACSVHDISDARDNAFPRPFPVGAGVILDLGGGHVMDTCMVASYIEIKGKYRGWMILHVQIVCGYGKYWVSPDHFHRLTYWK